MQIENKTAVTPKNLKHLDKLAVLMDAQFRIPGTSIRFGLDSIVGLIPGIGDLSTFTVSGYLMVLMAKNGASGFVLARMAVNILVDALIGSIPILGDLFDVTFKANMRNMRLLKEHYREGRHRGSAWKVIVPVLVVLFAFICLIIWGIYKLLAFIF